MKFLTRDALTARIAATANDVGLSGFAFRSQVRSERGTPDPADIERVRAALGDDAAGSRLLRFTLSGEARLDDGLALSMAGGKFDRYANNPVVLHNHRWWAPHPVGHSVVWTESSSDKGNRLRGVVAMLSREMSQALDRGFSWALGELAALRGHAASIGFDVLLAHPAPPEVRATNPWAMDVDEWDLLEWSLVTIPMDPNAVLDGRAAGIDTEPLVEGFSRLLDSLEAGGVERARIERAWAAAAQGRARTFLPTQTPAVIPEAVVDDAALVRDALRAGWGLG